jgi:hypothetical protein
MLPFSSPPPRERYLIASRRAAQQVPRAASIMKRIASDTVSFSGL